MLLNPSGDTDEPGDKVFNIVVMDRNFPVILAVNGCEQGVSCVTEI